MLFSGLSEARWRCSSKAGVSAVFTKQISLAGFAVAAAQSAEMLAPGYRHLPAFPGERPSAMAVSICCCFAFLRNIMEVFISGP